MEKVRVSPGDLEKIAAHAVQAYPDEACGLLFGVRGKDGYVVQAAKAIKNAQNQDAHRRFSISPDVLLQEHKAARLTGQVIIGHYHSHPNGQPTPSKTDIAFIADPQALWFIQSVENGRAKDLKAYRPLPEATGFKSLEVIVAKD